MKKKHSLKWEKFFSYFFKEILPRIILFIFIFLLLMPILFEFQTAPTVGKVFMALGTAFYFIIVIISWVFCEISRRKKPVEKRMMVSMRLMFIALLVSETYFSLRYFSATIWGTFGFVLCSIFMLLALYGIYSAVFNNFSTFFNQEKIPMVILALAISFAMIGGIEYNTNRNFALQFLRIAIGITYLYVIALTINLTILREKKKSAGKHRFLGLLFLLALIFVALISFPFYVNWCGISGKYFDTFTAVYSAVIGGGLTLVGVAWTIRKGDEDRKADRLQVEADRKEEERKKLIPYIKIVEAESKRQKLEKLSEKGTLIRLHEEQFAQHDKIIYRMRFCRTYIKNISSNTILFKDFYINGVPCSITNVENLAYSQETACMIFTHNYFFEALEPIKSLQLIYSDILENEYYFDCEVSIAEQHTEISPQGEIRCLTYYITRVGLPKLKQTSKETTNE